MQVAAPEHAVDEVRPIERSDEHERILAAAARATMSRADALGRRRRERVERHAGKVVAQPAELPVLGPEIVAPLADAVRFVDRDEPHAGLLQHPAEAPGSPSPTSRSGDT